MSSFESEFAHAQKHIGGFVDESLKGVDEDSVEESFGEGKEQFDYTPFSDRPKEDQTELVFQLQSLVAKKRDLIRSLNNEARERDEGHEDDLFGNITVIKQNGRFIPMRAEGLHPELGQITNEATVRTRQKLDDLEVRLAQYAGIPGLREAYEKETTKLYFHVRVMRESERLTERLVLIESALNRLNKAASEGAAGALVGVDRERFDKLSEMQKEVQERLVTLKNPQSVGPVLGRMMELEKYAENKEHGKIIEIPSAAAVIEDGLRNLRNGQPFMIAGHLGGGKTELARHIARLFMLENADPSQIPEGADAYALMEPEFFSGAEEASVYDLVGKLKLTQTEEPTPDEVMRKVDEYVEAAKKNGLELNRERIAYRVLAQTRNTVTAFNYGPLGRAIKEDKPIIIDELNMMPQDVVARINDILLKKPGEKIRLQENGEEEFTIGTRFAIISTVNIGKQYQGVKEFNAAFKSRWVGEELGYPPIEETFDLMLVTLMRKDRLRLDPNFPPEAYEKLIDLAIAIGEVQDLFTGKTVGQRFMSMVQGGSVAPEKSQLERSVVSTRDLMKKILEPWKQSGFTDSLDLIIARNILAPTGIDAKEDQKFMTELFLRRGFFAGWKSADFERFGIKDISDEELETLQALQGSDSYKEANAHYETLAAGARQNAGDLRRTMLIGNSALTEG